MPGPLLFGSMTQILQIDRSVFEGAPRLASEAGPVAVAPLPVAVAQPGSMPLPTWYRTPVVLIPIAAGAFIIGNVLMMIPWEVL